MTTSTSTDEMELNILRYLLHPIRNRVYNMLISTELKPCPLSPAGFSVTIARKRGWGEPAKQTLIEPDEAFDQRS